MVSGGMGVGVGVGGMLVAVGGRLGVGMKVAVGCGVAAGAQAVASISIPIKTWKIFLVCIVEFLSNVVPPFSMWRSLRLGTCHISKWKSQMCFARKIE